VLHPTYDAEIEEWDGVNPESKSRSRICELDVQVKVSQALAEPSIPLVYFLP
jgi:hypothetical protein